MSDRNLTGGRLAAAVLGSSRDGGGTFGNGCNLTCCRDRRYGGIRTGPSDRLVAGVARRDGRRQRDRFHLSFNENNRALVQRNSRDPLGDRYLAGGRLGLVFGRDRDGCGAVAFCGHLAVGVNGSHRCVGGLPVDGFVRRVGGINRGRQRESAVYGVDGAGGLVQSNALNRNDIGCERLDRPVKLLVIHFQISLVPVLGLAREVVQ